MVTQLKYGRYDHDSESLYDTCCQQIEVVKSALGQTKLAPEDVEHIIYAQCALLDKTAMELLAQGDEEGKHSTLGELRPCKRAIFHRWMQGKRYGIVSGQCWDSLNRTIPY
ncbi:DotU family type IV/VI secretion system protein [Providencia stuartii]|nr:DotU family type IV/VI secretion system protein [Providencia stuartii]